jgi:hypothetical protein
MNEKIKQLAEQATTRKFDGTGTDMGKLVLDQEKFAELIVEECGVALTPMLRDMISRGQAYNLIKQHFGVKE